VLAISAVALLLFVGLQIAPHDAAPAVAANANAVEPASAASAATVSDVARKTATPHDDAHDEPQRTAAAATRALRVRGVGTVPGEPSWPLEGVPVRVQRTEDHAPRERLEHTDRDGNAVFADVPAGTWQVTANCLMTEQQQTCTLIAQQAVAVELRLAFS